MHAGARRCARVRARDGAEVCEEACALNLMRKVSGEVDDYAAVRGKVAGTVRRVATEAVAQAVRDGDDDKDDDFKDD